MSFNDSRYHFRRQLPAQGELLGAAENWQIVRLKIVEFFAKRIPDVGFCPFAHDPRVRVEHNRHGVLAESRLLFLVVLAVPTPQAVFKDFLLP